MSDTRPGVPDECPLPDAFIRAPYGHGLMGFRFPKIPGILDTRPMRPSARFRRSVDRGEFGQRKSVPLRAWRAGLGSLVGEFGRAEYHFERFRECVDLARARRDVAGGPSFADFDVARAIYAEAVGYLSALRSAFDVIIFLAARRAGVDVGPASSRWKASVAIAPKPSDDTAIYEGIEEVELLRRYQDAFEVLNLYRNCMLHRGWHSQSFGYFAKSDDAPEAGLPQHNVMLVPDRASLARSSRPERWTYNDRRWLDDLVVDLEAKLAPAFAELGRLWGMPDPVDGTMPAEERPNVLLMVPRIVPEHRGAGRSFVIFETKKAAKLYSTTVAVADRDAAARPIVRAVRPTKLYGEGAGFLLVYDPDQLGEVVEFRMVALRLGELTTLFRGTLAPSAELGLGHNTLWLRLPELATGAIYLLDSPPTDESDEDA